LVVVKSSSRSGSGRSRSRAAEETKSRSQEQQMGRHYGQNRFAGKQACWRVDSDVDWASSLAEVVAMAVDEEGVWQMEKVQQ
jgi:hypothetical protein